MPPTAPAEKLRRKLKRTVLQSVAAFGLIEPGDRIMVCLSGGKDSYTLFDLLHDVRRSSPFPFDLIGVHLDQRQPGYDGRPLRAWLEGFGQPFEIISRDTYSAVLALTKPGGTYCAPCSRLRRGALYQAAERLGCNKLALGHHRDDGLQTLLMNLFFSGRLQAMPARYRTNCDRFEVIRPLIELAEPDIAEYAAHVGYPILPCNLCGSQSGLQRSAMAELLGRLERDIPNVRAVMMAAIRNVRVTHLLDQGLLERLDEVAAEAGAEVGCGPDEAAGREPLVVIGG